VPSLGIYDFQMKQFLVYIGLKSAVLVKYSKVMIFEKLYYLVELASHQNSRGRFLVFTYRIIH